MRYILLMDKSCISWLGKYLMITESWPPQVVQDLLISTAWGQMVRYLQKQLLHKPVRVSKKVQDQIATNIISTSLQPIGRLGVDYCWHWKKTKKVNNLEHVPNRFQLAFPLGPSVTWQKGALNIGMMSASKNPEKSKEWCIQTGKYKESTHDESLGIFLQMDLKEIHSLNARYLLHFASGISAHQWKLAVL